MVAGFNSIEGGEIRFDNQVNNDITPQKRNIGKVFQNYAIFPHLTAAKNVAFGLENKKVTKNEIQTKVESMLNVVQMKQFANRLPGNLSGGQQQRVALARAIVMEPNVLLMDEPLSNLDAKLRIDMRNAIKEIQNEVGITTLYVTHDQEEAMGVSDRIAVMKLGEIQQIGSPQQIYQRPVNIFVASFIGRTNVLQRKLIAEDGNGILVLDENYSIPAHHVVIKESGEILVKISIRPEEFIIDTQNKKGIKAEVIDSIFLGLNVHYFVKLENGEKIEVIQESEMERTIEIGTKVKLQVKEEKINVFDAETEYSLIEGVHYE